jgi:hypothetical protein
MNIKANEMCKEKYMYSKQDYSFHSYFIGLHCIYILQYERHKRNQICSIQFRPVSIMV